LGKVNHNQVKTQHDYWKEDHDRIMEEMARVMAKNIDTEILMSASGWMAFEFSEGTVYGQKYFTAHPTGGTKWDDMMEWLVNTLGPSAVNGVWTPNMRWYANNAKFWFRDKKDLEWFVLKWA
jgi:hypothetical protein